jgi:hypothetical protein
MLAAVRDRVQGVQVAAPMGRVPVVLEVLEGTLKSSADAPEAAPALKP